MQPLRMQSFLERALLEQKKSPGDPAARDGCHEYKFATTPHNYAATWVETASPNAMLGGSDRELKSDAKRSQLIGVPS